MPDCSMDFKFGEERYRNISVARNVLCGASYAEEARRIGVTVERARQIFRYTLRKCRSRFIGSGGSGGPENSGLPLERIREEKNWWFSRLSEFESDAA